MGTELKIYSKDALYWGHNDASRYEDAISDAISILSDRGTTKQSAINKLNLLIERAKQIGSESIEMEYQDHLRREAEEKLNSGVIQYNEEIPF